MYWVSFGHINSLAHRKVAIYSDTCIPWYPFMKVFIHPSQNLAFSIKQIPIKYYNSTYQVYPQPREVSVEDLDMQTGTDGKLLVSIQVQKRREWIQMLGADYPMNQLICSCLDDNPEKRPDMKTIVQQLDGIMMKTRSPSVLQVTKANGQSLLQLNTGSYSI